MEAEGKWAVVVEEILFISNVIFEPYLRTLLPAAFSRSQPFIQLNFLAYEELKEDFDILLNAVFVVVCLNFEDWYPNAENDILCGKILADDIERDVITRCQNMYSLLKNKANVSIIWFGFEDYYCNSHNICGARLMLDGLIDRINQQLCYMLSNDIYIDFKWMISKIGIDNAYNEKGKYRWNAPYSKGLISSLVDEVHKQYLIHTGKTKKCIVLDCDNVLWGGILSEDGIEGIKIGHSGLGYSFEDFQRFLIKMYYHGVILAICSKNDEADVRKVFREHSGMLLKEEYISCFNCNWDNKANNIKLISNILNIGLESIVFVDDSFFEIEAVKSLLPEVKTILYERNTIYENLSCFNLNPNPDLESINIRIQTYKNNSKREELRKQTDSFEEYLFSLEMRLDIHETSADEIERIAELTQRTNKCTNGRRYTIEQIKNIINSYNHHLYTVCLSDKFSDLGIVGVMAVKDETLMLISLSCRALGRGIEEEMLNFIKKQHSIKEFEYKATGKNEKLKSMLQISWTCIEKE